jgi:hypothetical protein
VGRRLVFAWQEVQPDWTRVAHHVGVLDLDARGLDDDFPMLTLTAAKPTFDESDVVTFDPAHAYSRAAVVAAQAPGHDLGLAYVSLGNVRDLQPWHGWLFELDLDAWRASAGATAVSAVMLTTANSQCGATGGDGSRQMACGGGIWAHLGPEVVYDPALPDGFELLVPTGNGMLDPMHQQFANGVLRVGHGLAFDPGCDPSLCDPFDPTAPTGACMGSCANLFMPRLLDGQPVPRGANDACVGKTLLECYAALDWDLGASAPARFTLPGGQRLALIPGKDGAVYLFDADHLGTLYDRAAIMDGCGEGGASCAADWAGTIATKPVVVTVDGARLALVPTFVFDDTHPAGLQALEIAVDVDGTPRFIPRWQVPSFDGNASAARTAFRQPPSGVTVIDIAGEPYALVVDVGAPGQHGTLYLVRVRDGAVLQTISLQGPGQRYAPPLFAYGNVYLSSCQHMGTPNYNEGPSSVEAFRIVAPQGL